MITNEIVELHLINILKRKYGFKVIGTSNHEYSNINYDLVFKKIDTNSRVRMKKYIYFFRVW